MAGTLDYEYDKLADARRVDTGNGAVSTTLHFYWTGSRMDNPKLCIHEFNGTLSVVMLSNKHGIVENIAFFNSKEAGERRMRKIWDALIDCPPASGFNDAEQQAINMAKKLGNKSVQASSVRRTRQMGRDAWKKPS